MTLKIDAWTPGLSPWMTRREAAGFLRWSVRTVDCSLTEMQDDRVPGMIRYRLQETSGSKRKKVRVLAEDVLAIANGGEPTDPQPINPFTIAAA